MHQDRNLVSAYKHYVVNLTNYSLYLRIKNAQHIQCDVLRMHCINGAEGKIELSCKRMNKIKWFQNSNLNWHQAFTCTPFHSSGFTQSQYIDNKTIEIQINVTKLKSICLKGFSLHQRLFLYLRMKIIIFRQRSTNKYKIFADIKEASESPHYIWYWYGSDTIR